MNDFEVALRLVISFWFAFGVGIERERFNKPAGLKTHILVGLASTLIALTSLYLFSLGYVFDMTRLSAGVITGVGFLGAGTLYKSENTVKGLTTASSLWLTTCVGLAIGFGFYSGAITTVLLLFVTLDILPKLFKK